MSITPYLDEFDADPETKRVLAVALEKTRVSLGLTDDLADGIIAKQIVELARAGERHPDLLCEGEDFTRAIVRRLTGGHRSASAPPLCKWASLLSSGLHSAVIRATQGRAIVIAAAASRGVGNSPRQ